MSKRNNTLLEFVVIIKFLFRVTTRRFLELKQEQFSKPYIVRSTYLRREPEKESEKINKQIKAILYLVN